MSRPISVNSEKRKATRISHYAMMMRCYCKTHPSYKRYGAKGITVCERWKNLDNFIEDMGYRPLSDKNENKYSIDRIDSTKGYEPGNCRWTLWKDNCAGGGKAGKGKICKPFTDEALLNMSIAQKKRFERKVNERKLNKQLLDTNVQISFI